jgi:hypothetical protein
MKLNSELGKMSQNLNKIGDMAANMQLKTCNDFKNASVLIKVASQLNITEANRLKEDNHVLQYVRIEERKAR